MADVTITGTHGSMTADQDPVSPFTGVTITDAGSAAGATETLSISLAGAGGSLQDGADYTGPRTLSGGEYDTYQITGTAAQVTQELDALSFTPSGNLNAGETAVTRVTLLDQSTSGAAARDDGTTVTDVPSNDYVSIDPQVSYSGGVFTLTGQASSALGVASVEISAVVDGGTRQDLGAATLNPDGTFSFADRIGADVQGLFVATLTDGAGAQATSYDPRYSLQGGLGPLYGAASQTRYTLGGLAVAAQTRFSPIGSQNTAIDYIGQAFDSAYDDTFDANRSPQATFVLNPGFSLDVVDQFRIRGPVHDTLSFLGSDFGGGTPQAELGTLLANSYNSGGGLFINDPTSGDAVQLKGVSKFQLVYNERDVVFR